MPLALDGGLLPATREEHKMTDNITLPRAAEQAREALELALRWLYACDDSEPDEPECDHGLHYHDCQHNPCPKRDCRAALAALDAALAGGSEMSASGDDCRQVAPEPDAKREPATHKQMAEAHGEMLGGLWFPDFKRVWRAAERFHGIREDGK
jgi:hypothetical protein